MFVTDPRVDLITFTGSTAISKHIMRQGAETMKRAFLELGGKSAKIILDDAPDFAQEVARSILVFHAGQDCAVQSRLLVPPASRSRSSRCPTPSVRPATRSIARLQSVFPPTVMKRLKGDIATISAERIGAVKPDASPMAAASSCGRSPRRCRSRSSSSCSDCRWSGRTNIARCDDPQDDLISLLWATEYHGKPATLNNLESYCVMLFLAGLDTGMSNRD